MISKGLPSIKIEKVEIVNGDYHVYAEPITTPKQCPECGWEIYKHDKVTQVVMDIPHGEHRVGILLSRRRYKCRGLPSVCGITFMQQCSDVDDHHRATKRLVKYIETMAFDHTQVDVAAMVGVSEGTVRNVVNALIDRLEKQYTFETPSILGVDELHLNKVMRLILTNIETRTIVDLDRDRSKKTFERALYRFKKLDQIKFVAMDMWEPYKDAANGVLGRENVTIVVDKFHVVKKANDAVENGRKALRESMDKKLAKALKHDKYILLKRESNLSEKQRFSLSGWAENYPDLKELHMLKEQLFNIFDSHMPRAQAEADYAAWERSIPDSLAIHFNDLTRAIRNWHEYVFNYFDTRITNAYTESANNHVKAIYKRGRGYSFEVLRAKVLYVEAKHKRVRKPFKSNLPSGYRGFIVAPEELNYGVEFPHNEENDTES